MDTPDSKPLPQQSRLVRQIAKGCFYVALLSIVWPYGGPRQFLIVLGIVVLGMTVQMVRKAASRSQLSSWDGRSDGDEEVPDDSVLILADPSAERGRLARQFVVGLLYLAFVSLILAGLTQCNFFLVFGAVSTGVIFTASIILVWAGSCVIRAANRRLQFSILTLLFLTLLAAIYLSAIRWFADLAGERLGTGENTFLVAAVICLVLTGFSLPFLLLFMDSLVWLAVWLVRRPWVQRCLRTRSDSNSPAGVENEESPNL